MTNHLQVSQPIRLESDGHIGISAEITLYYDRTKGTPRPGYFGTPIVVYVTGTAVVRVGRESDEVIASHSYTYLAKGPQRTTAVSRVWLPSQPVSVKVNGREVMDTTAWDAHSQTYLLKNENDPDGVRVEFVW